MNNARRKALGAITTAIEGFSLEDLMGDLEALRDEEQDGYDNMEGAGLGETEQAQRMTEAADALDSALDSLRDALDALDAARESIDEAVSA
jgi:hypothetical protein